MVVVSVSNFFCAVNFLRISLRSTFNSRTPAPSCCLYFFKSQFSVLAANKPNKPIPVHKINCLAVDKHQWTFSKTNANLCEKHHT